MENLDTEMQLKLEELIDKNMVYLNLEQDEWSKALHSSALAWFFAGPTSTGSVARWRRRRGWWKRSCGTAKQQLSRSTRVLLNLKSMVALFQLENHSSRKLEAAVAKAGRGRW